MAKRSAATDLNHDNWDAEDDKEEAGTFRRVSGEELKNRVIRKAKRSFSGIGNNNTTKSSSPFAAFSGFATSSPFGQFKKTDSASTGISPLLSDAQKSTKSENGSALDVKESKQESAKELQTVSGNTTLKQDRSIEYYRQLKSLNESVFKWMQLHLAKNSCCDFTPVFNDYKKHMDSLNVTYPIKVKENVFHAEDKDDTLSKSSMKSDESSSDMKDNNSNGAKKSGLKSESKDETDYGANFSARTTNTSTFSFGIKSTPTATSSVSPSGPTSSSKEEEKAPAKQSFQFTSGTTTSSKEGENAPSKPSFQFTFGNKTNAENTEASKGFSFASAIAAAKSTETAEEGSENYEPPKNDFVAVEEEDAIYSKKCKLFFKKGDNYADKGVGMLYLKSLEGKTQLLVRADTNLGNILLNIMLSSSLPMSRTGKNNVLLVCVPNPPVDPKNTNSKEAIPMLIRVKTAEDADELLEVLNKHKS